MHLLYQHVPHELPMWLHYVKACATTNTESVLRHMGFPLLQRFSANKSDNKLAGCDCLLRGASFHRMIVTRFTLSVKYKRSPITHSTSIKMSEYAKEKEKEKEKARRKMFSTLGAYGSSRTCNGDLRIVIQMSLVEIATCAGELSSPPLLGCNWKGGTKMRRQRFFVVDLLCSAELHWEIGAPAASAGATGGRSTCSLQHQRARILELIPVGFLTSGTAQVRPRNKSITAFTKER